MSFNDFSDFMPTDNTVGILLESGEVLVTYDFGEGEVQLTLNELAEALELDPLVLRDYYIKYNEDLNVAVLAAQNDKSMLDSVEFVRHALGISYLVEHSIQDTILRYNRLLGIKTKVLKQIEYFMTFNKDNDDARLSISGDQLKTLMLRSFTASKVIPRNIHIRGIQQVKLATSTIIKKALFDIVSKKLIMEPLYATSDKVATMEGISKIADGRFNEVNEDEILSIRRNLSENTSRVVMSAMVDAKRGLSLKSAEIEEVYELFTSYHVPLNKNVEIFEDLSARFELEYSQNKLEAEGPLLKMNK